MNADGGAPEFQHHGLVGVSPQISSLRRLIDKAAVTPFPVILLGESGTGKEVVARAIHRASLRADRPLVTVDCASLVGSLMESDLFGHVKGSFSGANTNKIGLIEMADGGTVFFDEIGELPLELQTKLLRLTQEGELRAVGALRSRTVNLRIIAATNRNLKEEVRLGRFRLDLFYRLNVVPIHLPSLRDRREDIPLLINHFLNELETLGPPSLHLAEEILEALGRHQWPGNVRELKHCIERLVAFGLDDVAALEGLLRDLEIVDRPLSSQLRRDGSHVDKVFPIRENEKRLISDALISARGNRADAAELLKISRTTLYRRIKTYGDDWSVPVAANAQSRIPKYRPQARRRSGGMGCRTDYVTSRGE